VDNGSFVVTDDVAFRHAQRTSASPDPSPASHGIELHTVAGAEHDFTASVASGHLDDDVMFVVHAVPPLIN
jgi:hypothetical protein